MINQLNPIDLYKVEQTIKEVTHSLTICRQRISELHLETDLKSNLNDSLEQIKGSQQQFHHIINEYFKDLGDNFVFLQSKYPKPQDKEQLLAQIDHQIKQLEEYERKWQNNELTADDLIQMNYIQFDPLYQQIDSQLNQEDDSLPQVKVNHRVVEGLYLALNQYASISWPGDIGMEQSTNLMIENNSFTKVLPILDEQECSYGIYDVVSNETKLQKYTFNVKSNIDYSATVIQDVDHIYFCGGVTNAGFISSAFYVLNNNQLTRLPDLMVKRIGAGGIILIIDQVKYLYLIGGKVDNKIKTKLCERFNFQTQKWESINKMNHARSKSAIVHHANSIYVFFGIDSENQNTSVVESLDLTTHTWKTINIPNHLPGFDVSDCCGISINQSQIVLFGGIRYSLYFPDQMYFNRKVLTFNTTNDTLSIVSPTLPIDFFPYCNPIIHNNEIYAIGRILKNAEEKPQMFLDGGFIIKINKEAASIVKFLKAFKKQ